MAKTTYEAMGIAAMLPGMRHMHELMGQQIAAMEQTLQALQNSTDLRTLNKGARANPGSKSYWDKMTPEERSAEMRRRAKVSVENGTPNVVAIKAANKKAIKQQTAQKAFWENMSPQERERQTKALSAKMKKIQAARKKVVA